VVQRSNGGGGGEVWEKVRGKTVAEGDWWPVLHRDLRAGNVFLQHPRGVETYGAVKLGGFGRCFVSSGAVGGERGMPVVAMEREDGVGLGALRERMGRWKRDHLGLAQVSLFSLLLSFGSWGGCGWGATPSADGDVCLVATSVYAGQRALCAWGAALPHDVRPGAAAGGGVRRLRVCASH
jgi:hypothetical protein